MGYDKLKRNRIPKGLFFWAYGVSVLLHHAEPFLYMLVMPSDVGRREMADGTVWDIPYMMTLYVVLQLAFLFSLIVFCAFIHRIWKAIQDGHASTSPNKAVGFIFIPVFNLFWFFQAFWGFAKDYNRFIDRHELDLRRLPGWLYLAYALLASITVLTMVPIAMRGWKPPASPLGAEPPFIWCLSIVALIRLVLELVVIWKGCDAVNALPESLIQRNLQALGMVESDHPEEGTYRGARTISKPLHIALFLAGFPAAALLFYFTIIQASHGRLAWVILLVVLPLAAVACSFHALINTIHKSWKAIQDGHARTSPREAVNFLFIPLFNLYWAFRVIGGFATDYNRLLTRHRLDAPPLSRRLYLIFSIFAVTFPFTVFLLFFPSTRAAPVIWIIAGVMFIWRSCDAINALPRPTKEDASVRSLRNQIGTETTP